MDDRYNAWHTVGEKKFYLEPFVLDIEESKFLLYKVVEQAIQDYVLLTWSNISYKDLLWTTARDFIFEDDYFIDWGEFVFNLETICEILDLDVDWIRRKSEERFEREKIKREQKRRSRADEGRETTLNR